MKTLKKALLTLVFIFASSFMLNAFADGDPPPPPGSHGAPIDGGLGILVAAGLGYGAIKKYRSDKANKKLNKPEE